MSIPILPLNLVSSLERRLVTSVAEARSPFTGTSQIQDWGASWWEYQIEMAVTQGAKARRLSAFFTALGGMRGRFLFPDPSIEVPIAAGNPYVIEAQAAGASTLRTAGWGLGLRAGDFFQLGSDVTTRLYQLTADVTPLGSEVTLAFVPPLRASVPVGTLLGLETPSILLRLTAPVPSVIGRADQHRFTISAREAL
ncbi:hypothetical protein [Thalassobacter sp. 16PALIMAR09]|uniref:hypothetical protein n=1 Tax=Thalassobacter sp. 16PALIMAR09 TaxID=1225651 RepID=UPI00051D213D|nr:hypothetical protein [Thalassobacter sp. 16PALIMAR09]KGK99887.1 hypothetical protein PM04_17270 [Thalassobacter sp. 16PALIMAR09]